MKIRLLCLLCAPLTLGLLPSCTSVPSVESDWVKIIEVKSAKIPGGDFTSYKVKVGYSLASKAHGEVALGFDVDEPGLYTLMAERKVDRGQGEVELMADVRLPKRSVLTVYSNLSEDPHPNRWDPLAQDRQAYPIMK